METGLNYRRYQIKSPTCYQQVGLLWNFNYCYFNSNTTTLCAGNSITNCSPSFLAPLKGAI